MYAEILAIGDEIVSGQTLDTNSQWLSRRLEESGVRTLYHATVGDELDPCIAVFRQAIERADLVIATGGLGPTADDLTREALAKAVGRELVLFPQALEQIRSLFARRKREMPKQNELQAMFPAGSRMIVNPNGTAPGIDLEIPRPDRTPCRFFALPGVPAEMIELWNGYLREEIEKLACISKKIVRRKLNCFGAGESQVESMLPDLIRRGRTPTVGITASNATISLRIDAEGATEEECNRLIEPVEKTIRDCLGLLVFGEGNDELQHAVVRLLLERQQSLTVIEGCTGGLVSQWLSDAPGSEKCFFGGIVLPNEEIADRHKTFHFSAAGFDPSRVAPSLSELGALFLSPAKADWILIIHHFPEGFQSDRTISEASLPKGDSVAIQLARRDPADIKTKNISLGFHPALQKIYIAKQALNWMRLTLLAQEFPHPSAGRK